MDLVVSVCLSARPLPLSQLSVLSMDYQTTHSSTLSICLSVKGQDWRVAVDTRGWALPGAAKDNNCLPI